MKEVQPTNVFIFPLLKQLCNILFELFRQFENSNEQLLFNLIIHKMIFSNFPLDKTKIKDKHIYRPFNVESYRLLNIAYRKNGEKKVFHFNNSNTYILCVSW